MLDRNEIKKHGIRYGRTLQVVFITSSMFSADHVSAASQFQNSFNVLNGILKECGQFTIGFVDNRVLLNNMLTQEPTLNRLENEFLKRKIGAITFPAGLTLASYKRSISILAANPKLIEEEGGLLEYLEKNPLEKVRVFPAGANQTRTESGDTLLDTDSESFLMSKAFADARPAGGALETLESLLDTANRGGGLGGGSGTGPGGGSGPGGGGPGGGSGPGGGGPGGGGSGIFGAAPGGGGPAAAPAPTTVEKPKDIMSMVEGYLESNLESASTPQRSYQELARVIQDLRPDFMLAAFPAERREELRALPPDQMATELIEDTTVRWAVNRLANAPSGSEAVIVEEEVIRVLLRTLQVSQAAERMGRKLTDYLKQMPLPQHMTDRIHDELRWASVPAKTKTERLLGAPRWNRLQFRRAIEQIRELVRRGDQENASRLGIHYFKIFDSAELLPEELGRIPELLRVMGPVRTGFWQHAADYLVAALHATPDNEFHHKQVVNAAVTLAQTVAVYEDFKLVHNVGAGMEKLAAAHPEEHARCCTTGLASILTSSAVDRIFELYLEKKEDGDWGRTAGKLLRWSGATGIERAFHILAEEKVAANRLSLLRLIGRLGPEALNMARQQLASDAWYVVRNACKVLVELKDPDLLADLAPALRHADERVQKAAVAAVLDSRVKGRGVPLAEALGELQPQLLDEVLGELTFLKDPQTIPGLRRFLLENERRLPPSALVRGAQAVGAIKDAAAGGLLAEVLNSGSADVTVRRAALQALQQRPDGRALLEEFLHQQPGDPLAGEAQQALGAGAR